MQTRDLTVLFSLVLILLAGPAALTAQAPSQNRGGGDSGLPLEAADTLRFTTDEGTWISLDVTPDGEAVVFELLGDIYRVPLSGGDAERITSGMGFDSQPRVSPDGQWIAFVSDRDGADNLWVARMDGSGARKLTSETQNSLVSPAWMPDSRHVVVTRRGPRPDLRMHHIDGGSGITVGGGAQPSEAASGPGAQTARPNRVGVVASPDGRYLYFAQSGGGGGPGGGYPRWQIARMNMATGDVDPLTQAEFSAYRPALSPDGTLLVYATRYETETGLRVRNLESGADRWLIWPVQPDELEGGGIPSRDLFPGYAFTPDGREVVVTFDGKIQRVEVASGEVTPVPFTAQVELAIGPDLTVPKRVPDGPLRATLVQDPRFSPDGTRMAASVLTGVYVMDVIRGEEGARLGPPRRLNSDGQWAFKPAWSPDGRWIAYVTWDGSGGHIWRVRADGRGTPERLTRHEAFYTDLVYAPDGERIVGLRGNAFLREQTFSEFGGLRIPLDLVWLPAAGGDVSLVSPARGLGLPHFGDDPSRIYVYSREGLVSLRFDGTDRRTHLRVTGPGRTGVPTPPPAQGVMMHPSGQWALAAVNNQLWAVIVPPYTGDAASVSVRGPAVPVHQLTEVGADYFGWADGGETLVWAIGSTVYRRPLSTVDFRQEEADSVKAEKDEEEEAEEADPPPGPEGAEPGAGADPDEAADPEQDPGEAQDPDADPDAAEDTEEDPDDDEPRRPRDLHESVEVLELAMEFPRARASGTIVLRGGTAITMSEAGVIENADVVVTDHRIAAVGARGTVTIPEGAREFDVSGRYLVPGFVDTHAHWEFRTHDVLEPYNWTLMANLAYGVTAGLDVQTSTNDYFAYRDLVETGWSPGQRAFMTGPGVFSNQDFRSYEATYDYLRRYVDHYRTPNIKSYMVGNRRQRQWVVKASHELGLLTTTEGGRDLRLDLTHAIDGMHGNEHTLPVVPLYRDVVELYARTRTAYTPTLVVQYGGPSAVEWFFTRTEVLGDEKLNRFYPQNRLAEMARRRSSWVRDDEFRIAEAAADALAIKRAGGLVGVGGHGEVQGLGYHWEMWALAMGGFTPMEVLEAATIDGARIMGYADDLGSLEEGKLADLVVLDRSPLDDIGNTNSVRWVMKNGELYEGDTLRRLWPTEWEPQRFWWWGAEPRDRREGR